MYRDSYVGHDTNEYVEEMNPVLSVKSSEHEKSASFRSALDMRNEASFCDVAFLVQGCLFRAHKIIVRCVTRTLMLYIFYFLRLIQSYDAVAAHGVGGYSHSSQRGQTRRLFL